MISVRVIYGSLLTGSLLVLWALHADAVRPVHAQTGPGEHSADSQEKAKGAPMLQESAWTWGYFFAAKDGKAIKALAGEYKSSLSVYQVEKVVAVKGKPGVTIANGSRLIRMETACRLALPEAKAKGLLLHGLPQHLQYTTREQREELVKSSRPELAPGKDTVAVIIPIRKTAAWWNKPVDERMAYFQKKQGKVGHTAIGAKYAGVIYRKLYHTRYAVETTDHDFITYFEFERKHTDDFNRLLAQLRDLQQNPEWGFVDREYEIWTTKTE